MGNERRIERSPFASKALQIQLRNVRERFGVDRIVLCDRLGHLWASSDLHVDSVGLARALPRRDAEHAARVQKRAVQVREVEVGAAKLLLAAEGAQAPAALDAAHSGVERILSHLASAVKPRSSWRAGELLTG
ncbi:MAG: hypothetical protein KC503_03545 [Myxococcales bacterium]|nr:hypothetical protein [Myxococcales bacterium]